MCYESLADGDATERPLTALLRAELRDAVGNGLAATVIVVAVLAARGADPALTLLAAVGALALGALVHQALLVVGTVALRVWDDAEFSDRSTDVSGHEV